MPRGRIEWDGVGRCFRRDCLIGCIEIDLLGWVGKARFAVFEMIGSGVHYYDGVGNYRVKFILKPSSIER